MAYKRIIRNVFSIALFMTCLCFAPGFAGAHAEDAWCSVFEDTAGLPVERTIDITTPPEGNKALQQIELLRIPAAEVYQAVPGTCLRNVTVQCGENSYRLIVSKPRLPEAYRKLVEASNVSYLMVTDRSEIYAYEWDYDVAKTGKAWDESCGRYPYVSNTKYPEEKFPAFVDLIAFDPNEDFEIDLLMSLDVLEKKKVDLFSYRYRPESIWGVRIAKPYSIKPEPSIYCMAGQVWSTAYEDSSIHASCDRLDVPDYLLDNIQAIGLRGSATVWDYHPYTGGPLEETPPAAPSGIPDVFRDFLFSGGYRQAGQQFGDENEISVTMRDVDEDGSEELLMTNGGDEDSQKEVYVYTVTAGAVRYTGSISCWYPDEGICILPGVKGIACYDYDPEAGQSVSSLFTLAGGTLQEQSLLEDTVYNSSYLHWYKLLSLPGLGWEAFCSAPFVLDVLDVSLDTTPDEFTGGIPLAVSLTIKNGTPPFNISWWFETVDEETSNVVASGQDQTKDSHYHFTYTPEGGKALWLTVFVSDLYGTAAGGQEECTYEIPEASGRQQQTASGTEGDHPDEGMELKSGDPVPGEAEDQDPGNDEAEEPADDAQGDGGQASDEDTWTCGQCGQAGNTQGFCTNCGSPAPTEEGLSGGRQDDAGQESGQEIETLTGLAFTTGHPKVNVRKEPDQEAGIIMLWKNTDQPLSVTGHTVDLNGTGWYRIGLTDGQAAFIRDDLLTVTELDSLSGGTEESGAAAYTEKATLKKNVNVRSEPDMTRKKNIISRVQNAGTTIRVYGMTYDQEGQLWYYAFHDGSYGYILGELLE